MTSMRFAFKFVIDLRRWYSSWNQMRITSSMQHCDEHEHRSHFNVKEIKFCRFEFNELTMSYEIVCVAQCSSLNFVVFRLFVIFHELKLANIWCPYWIGFSCTNAMTVKYSSDIQSAIKLQSTKPCSLSILMIQNRKSKRWHICCCCCCCYSPFFYSK